MCAVGGDADAPAATPSGARQAAACLDDITVGMAYRFVRVGGDITFGCSIWRPVYGADSESTSVQSFVNFSVTSPPPAGHDDTQVVALSLGDVLCEGECWVPANCLWLTNRVRSLSSGGLCIVLCRLIAAAVLADGAGTRWRAFAGHPAVSQLESDAPRRRRRRGCAASCMASGVHVQAVLTKIQRLVAKSTRR